MDLPECRDRVLVLQVKNAHSQPGNAWVEFAVTDIGAGIGADVQTQLFNPFFTTKAEGMGLGLSLCRTVVEQHGGHLTFGPHAPKGTVFRFTLPAASDAPAAT
jgi:two-component system sensor histidine kinase DctS